MEEKRGKDMRNVDYNPNAAITKYRRKHPEKVKQWRTNEKINGLRREGYTIISPDGVVYEPIEQ